MFTCRLTRNFLVVCLSAILLLSSCTSTNVPIEKPQNYGLKPGKKYAGHYKVGKPYKTKAEDKWYYPKEHHTYDKVGEASWYGPYFHNRRTANGDTFNKRALTAAHNTLPMPSMVRVTNLSNGRAVVLMINDRGPFKKNREIDVSERAAELLAFKQHGHTKVRVEYLKHETDMMLAELGLRRSEGALASKALATDSPLFSHIEKGGEEAIVAKASPQAISLPRHEPPTKPITAPESMASLGHYIQVGAFGDKANAEKVAGKIADLGRVDITPIPAQNNQMLYRVRLGPIGKRVAAEQALKKVIHQGNNQAILVANR